MLGNFPQTVMTTKPIKIGATIAVVVLALGGLLYATLSEGTEYYKHVDEVMVDPAAWHGKRLQLHGYVVDKSIRKKPNTLEYLFDIQSNGKVVQARYTGVVPDTFKDGSEVVLKGQLGPDGFHVDRNGVMAKCPSKYEPAKGSLPSAGS
jgi:cytochrome c-type biogenesis protein CcmE